MNNVPHLTVFIWKHTSIQNIGTLALAEKRDLNELLSRRSILEIVGLFYVAHTTYIPQKFEKLQSFSKDCP